MRCAILSLIILSASCVYSQLNQKAKLKVGYQDSLKKAVRIINEGANLNASLIEYCIPDTKDESYIYYHLDDEPESTKAFSMLDNRIFNFSLKGNKDILKRYLLLSQFVDGYFAEAYFEEYIPQIVRDQRELFCNAVNTLGVEKVPRLSSFIKETGCK